MIRLTYCSKVEFGSLTFFLLISSYEIMLLSNSIDIKLCFVLLCMLPLALKRGTVTESENYNLSLKDVTSDAIFHTYCKLLTSYFTHIM